MKRQLVSFDWALKNLLRNKANFEILEGFFSELLQQDIKIKNIIESEGNKQTSDDKSNRVDLLAEATGSELILIELQVEGQFDYFHRMLYGASKLITDYMVSGFEYHQVRKVISINIVYFDLGQGEDYIYKGVNEFRGIHKHDILRLSTLQKKSLPEIINVSDIYPEYYILKVNDYDDLANDSLDEWMYFLKNSEIPDGFKAKGLQKAAKELDILKLSKEKRAIFEHFINDRRIAESSSKTAVMEGVEKGIVIGTEKGIVIGTEKGIVIGTEKGIEIGEKKKNVENARKMKQLGVASEIIMQVTGLNKEEIEAV
ncbi:MAG: Rpn family recombination-promoting nuclease/putative transposase [Deltaproteobacteria bacterium]